MSKDVNLKLKAETKEDLDILSAYLQDAIFPISTMIFDKDDSSFTLMANRFCWEKEQEEHDGIKYNHRIHTALSFKDVKIIYRRGFSKEDDVERSLSILTIYVDETNSDGHKIHLVFSSGKEICLIVEKINCFFADLEEPWLSPAKPEHIHDIVQDDEENNLTNDNKGSI